MPKVFSPGEPETRPLDPSAIVYTTAQKVADLLDIGPQEAIEVSANSLSGAVFVTGTDYRNHGFAVGDSLLIYSDADPLGKTATISSITSDTSGVKLNFTDITLTAADYQTADNTYIQNQASFTNGKTRGVKRSSVEDHILRMQDRIDNLTHNAWRPYVVAAEYINFDTYKPYRRRYYTDYVGTTPLLHRNVQQVLRLELWQGNDYREIGAAEAHVNITDISALAGKSLYFCPGNSGVATLSIGTGTTNWRADFDETTAAQSLADLINKEDRVSKTAVAFSPTFTLEGSTDNVAIHDEFYATANADYGTGVVKITSKRPVKAGETCTIAYNSATGLDIDQIQGVSGNSASVSSTTVTVGYIYDDDGVATTEASDTAGFADSGLLEIGSEVLSYTGKTPTVLNDAGVVTSWGTFTGCINVSGTPLTTLNTTGTSFIQYRFSVDLQGGSGSGDSGRLRDWWIDYEMGIIYFNNSYPFFEWNAVKVSYVYGERYLEKAIEDICTKLVAIELLLSDDRSVLLPEGTQNIDLTSKVQLYKADVERILPRYVEVVNFA